MDRLLELLELCVNLVSNLFHLLFRELQLVECIFCIVEDHLNIRQRLGKTRKPRGKIGAQRGNFLARYSAISSSSMSKI